MLAGTAGVVAGLVGARTPAIVEAAAGLAPSARSWAPSRRRSPVPRPGCPPPITFLVVGSGVAVAGIGSAFWGVLAGGIALALLTLRGPRGGADTGGRIEAVPPRPDSALTGSVSRARHGRG